MSSFQSLAAGVAAQSLSASSSHLPASNPPFVRNNALSSIASVDNMVSSSTFNSSNKFILVIERNLNPLEKQVLQNSSTTYYNPDINPNNVLSDMLSIHNIVVLDYREKDAQIWLECNLAYIKANSIKVVVIRRSLFDTELIDIADLVIKKLPPNLINSSQDALHAFLSRQKLKRFKSTIKKIASNVASYLLKLA